MELIRGLHNLRERHRGCVLTIGNFDGVHRGHQALLSRTADLARAVSLPPAVLSFEPTPREFFAPDACPSRTFTFRDKCAALAHFGMGRFVVARFDGRIAALTPEDFVQELLVKRFGIAALVIGDDFRFGRQRAGDEALLRRLGAQAGFEVFSVGAVEIEGERCSSTALRDALSQPDLTRAARLLGRRYTLRGRVRRGLQLGRKLGMPTANIDLHRPLALREGVYAIRARCEGQQWDGVASLGARPTLGMTRCLLEAHVFGDPGSLYGRELVVEFHAFLRPQLKFDSLDALAARMQQDADEARDALRALA